MDNGRQTGMLPQSSGKATGSLICGILGLICVLPLVGPIAAVILGHMAHGEIKRSNGQLTGEGKATAGLVLGYIGLVAALLIVPIAIMAGMMLPVLSKAREKARRVNCAGNLKQIGLASLMYSGDNKGQFPPDLATLVNTQYLPAGRVYQCPSAPDFTSHITAADIQAGRASYDYFGAGMTDDNPKAGITVLAADKPGNHPGGQWINVLFIDGHVQGCRAADIYQAAKQNGWIVPGAR